jgi:hypothetical protein
VLLFSAEFGLEVFGYQENGFGYNSLKTQVEVE